MTLNGVDLKGALTENTWELPNEYSTIPSSLQLPSIDESNNEVLQPPSTANDEPTVPIVSPMALPPLPSLQPSLVEVNKGEKDNPKGDAMANSTQEKQNFQMPKMIDLSTFGLRHSTQSQRAPEQYSYFTMLLGVSNV
eukprot:15366401-Ditylum_brightwellii.AAC.3